MGALLLAFDPYHATYTSEAYLEAVPGLLSLLAVLAFEKARRGAGPGPFRSGWLATSGALLGLAAAGKYPDGSLVGLTLLPFLIHQARSQVRPWAWVVLPAMVAFFVGNPALWPSPLASLRDSVLFHWGYSQGSDDVQRLALPWFEAFMYLMHPGPAKWHPGIFATSLNARILLPLALIGARATIDSDPSGLPGRWWVCCSSWCGRRSGPSTSCSSCLPSVFARARV